jgi:hypothetical protein
MTLDQRPYAERDTDRECYWVHLTELQAQAMADGFMPHGVRSVLRELLDCTPRGRAPGGSARPEGEGRWPGPSPGSGTQKAQ